MNATTVTLDPADPTIQKLLFALNQIVQHTASLGSGPRSGAAAATAGLAGMKPPASSATAASGLTGAAGHVLDWTKKAAAGIAALGGKVKATFANLSGGVTAALGAMQQGFVKLQDAFARTIPLANPAAWIRYRLAMDDLNATIGQALLPAFLQFTAAIRHLADMVISLPKPVKDAVSAFAIFGAGVTAAGGALTLLAPLIAAASAGLTALITVGSALAAAFGSAAAAFALPLAPIAALTAALTAGVGVWAAYKTGLLDALAKFGPLAKLMGTLKGMAKALEGAFAGFLPLVSKIAALGLQAFEGLAATLAPLITQSVAITRSFMPLADYLLKIGGALGGKVLGVVSKLSAAFQEMGAKLTAKLGPFIQSILPAIGKIGQSLMEAFEAAQPAIDSLIDLGKELFDLFLEYGLPAITNAVNLMAEAIKASLPAFKLAVNAAKGMFDFMRDSFKALEGFINKFIDSFKGMYDGVRDALKHINVELPELKFGGDGPAPEFETPDFDKAAEGIEDALKGLGNLWKAPTNSSVGAAARPATFTAIEEFGRQATLAAYGAASVKPEDKIVNQLKEDQAAAVANAQAIVDAVNQAAADSAAAAIRGF